MKRRTLLGTAAMTFGGASVLGTNAFTSVEAQRSVTVDVVGDASAFLKLEPCGHGGSVDVDDADGDDDEGGEVNPGISPSDAIVVEDGMIRIDLTKHNHKLAGHGITENSVWRFPNALDITNQGSQPVCVDLCVGTDIGTDACGVPAVGAVDDDDGELNFAEGDPAVILYKGENREETFEAGIDTTTSPLSLGQGESVCVGFDVRTFRLSGDDLSDMTLLIRADAGGDCGTEGSDGSTESDGPLQLESVSTYKKVKDSDINNAQGNSRIKFDIKNTTDTNRTVSTIKIKSAENNAGDDITRILGASSNNDDDKDPEIENRTSEESLFKQDSGFELDHPVELDSELEISSDGVSIGIGSFRSDDSSANMKNGSGTIVLSDDTEWSQRFSFDLNNN